MSLTPDGIASCVLVDISDIHAIRRFGPTSTDILLLTHEEFVSGDHDEAVRAANVVALGAGKPQIAALRYLVDLLAERGTEVELAIDLSGDDPTDLSRLAEPLLEVPDTQILGVKMVGSAACLVVSCGGTAVPDDVRESVFRRISTPVDSTDRDLTAIQNFRIAADYHRLVHRISEVEELEKRLAQAERQNGQLTRRLQNARRQLKNRSTMLQQVRGRLRATGARLSSLEQSPYVRIALRLEEAEVSLTRRLRGHRRAALLGAALVALLLVTVPVLVALAVAGTTTAELLALLLLASVLLLSGGPVFVGMKYLRRMSELRRVELAHHRAQMKRIANVGQRMSRQAREAARRDKGLTKSLDGLRSSFASTVKQMEKARERAVRGLSQIEPLTEDVKQLQSETLPRLQTLVEASAGVQESVEALRREQQRLHRHSRAQLEASANLFHTLSPRAGVPGMGGWAASPDVLRFLVNEVLQNRPGRVLECGSGVSTLFLALAIGEFDLPSRVIALEHDAQFAEQAMRALELHGVAHLAEVRVAPLVPVTGLGHATHWYDPAALEGISDVGLLFVDGPPGDTGPLARWAAVPLVQDRLSDQCTIVLDDLVRADEKDVAARWREMLSGFSYEEMDFEKGAAVFRRRPGLPD